MKLTYKYILYRKTYNKLRKLANIFSRLMIKEINYIKEKMENNLKATIGDKIIFIFLGIGVVSLTLAVVSLLNYLFSKISQCYL